MVTWVQCKHCGASVLSSQDRCPSCGHVPDKAPGACYCYGCVNALYDWSGQAGGERAMPVVVPFQETPPDLMGGG